MHRSLIEVCLLVMAAILLVPAYGWSQEHGGHGEAGTPVRDARFGVLFTGGGSRDDLDTTPTLGVMVVGELMVVPDLLEVEIASGYTRHGADHGFTEAFLLKKPWHAGEHVEFFLGAGGMVRQHLATSHGRQREEHENRCSTGPLVQAGSIYWLADHWGVTAEVEYIQDIGIHTREVEGLAGLLYRFGGATH